MGAEEEIERFRAETKTQRWLWSSMVQLRRIREARAEMMLVRTGVDDVTLRPFLQLETEHHFLVIALDHLRPAVRTLGHRKLAGLLPNANQLRAVRNAFEHPGAAEQRYTNRHAGNHRQDNWDASTRGSLSDLIDERELEQALIQIYAALWPHADHSEALRSMLPDVERVKAAVDAYFRRSAPGPDADAT